MTSVLFTSTLGVLLTSCQGANEGAPSTSLAGVTHTMNLTEGMQTPNATEVTPNSSSALNAGTASTAGSSSIDSFAIAGSTTGSSSTDNSAIAGSTTGSSTTDNSAIAGSTTGSSSTDTTAIAGSSTEIIQTTTAAQNKNSKFPSGGGIPGLHTVANFLETALEPMGGVLYIYGGGWNYEDTGSSDLARSIGVASSWQEFFDSQDANYDYHDTSGVGANYYPEKGLNTYFAQGLDCSGYVGWCLYNTIYDESLAYDGFVCSSTNMAKSLADAGYGTFVHPDSSLSREELIAMMAPGDIISIPGHVYIVLGVCDDGSLLLINSTVSPSVTGKNGGGVELNAVSVAKDLDENCESYRLAKAYTSQYYPEWEARYPVVMKKVSVFLSFPESKMNSGIFHWSVAENASGQDLANVFYDPEGIQDLSGEQVMELLFR